MVKIDVLCVGKLKETFYRDAVAEYAKRLSPFCRLRICEAADEKAPERLSPAEEERLLAREGERIKGFWEPRALHAALAIDGKRYDSPGFAAFMEQAETGGTSHFQFIIGSSLGLSGEVLRAAECRISFSAMTFPHQLMRVILLEQIYRGFMIRKGAPYHK